MKSGAWKSADTQRFVRSLGYPGAWKSGDKSRNTQLFVSSHEAPEHKFGADKYLDSTPWILWQLHAQAPKGGGAQRFVRR